MQVNCSKGPWHIEKSAKWEIFSSEEYPIAEVFMSGGPTRAEGENNAKLMAMAHALPDMIEVLKGAIKWFDDNKERGTVVPDWYLKAAGVIGKYKTAIK